jgi:leucyl-tRNA synthetase
MTVKYNPFAIEEKWQKTWNAEDTFRVSNTSAKPKYYVLEMFPYPSGKLHMGHVRNYTIGDVLARVKHAQGYDVLHPMGWDAFGMPAENAAIKNKVHPKKWTYANIDAMRADMQRFGLSYDWSRELATCHPKYYGQGQALFIDMYTKGLIYEKESYVNWDPVDQTVLANEQVIDGKGWRSGAPVERRSMKQWFLKITDYADELLADLQQLTDWPERVRLMQENWIGKSEGLTFRFAVDGHTDGFEVYTTRPDTIMGVTFCSVAAEHPLAAFVAEKDPEAAAFVKECLSLGTALEAIETAEKKGYDTGLKAVHPVTGDKVPVYIANYVLMGYGTGAVMGVPAHDERDFAFAQKYGLGIKTVIQSNEAPSEGPWTGTGTLVNSGPFNGLDSTAAKGAVIDWFEQNTLGKRTLNYRLRDWGVSRQRYWGTPIPFITCPSCGTVPVPKEQLPVELPEDVEITGSGNPLDKHPTWKHTPCPKCGTAAQRVTDTMDTFVDSSWYFARYTDVNAAEPLNKQAANRWLPVDQYIGGIEHAILHLLYARFFTKVLRDLGYVSVDEPFKALLTQGMVINNSYQNAAGDYINPVDVDLKADGTATHLKTGEALTVNRMEKMSKSKNNGVDPSVLVDRYGADTLRLFMMFMAPPERDLEWSDAAVDGAWRFIGRLWNLVHRAPFALPEAQALPIGTLGGEAKTLKRTVHKTIRKVTDDVNRFQFNTMIAAVMELSNALGSVGEGADDATRTVYREGVEAALRLLNPIIPHVTEELWAHLGHTTRLWDTPWPTVDPAAVVDDEITLVVQMNGKLKTRLTVPADISQQDAQKRAVDALADQLAGLTVRKCIVVPGRLVNVVAN